MITSPTYEKSLGNQQRQVCMPAKSIESLGSGAKAEIDTYLTERNVQVSALFHPDVDARFDEMRKLIGAPLPEAIATQSGARHTNQFNPLPELTQLVDVPVRIFTNAGDLNKVKEFIIFQHGITGTNSMHTHWRCICWVKSLRKIGYVCFGFY